MQGTDRTHKLENRSQKISKIKNEGERICGNNTEKTLTHNCREREQKTNTRWRKRKLRKKEKIENRGGDIFCLKK
ncbi:hypothetical protein I7I48_03257 [Histoplasma ohiense]|nr:hypothetical protein I7I48_03257 [Histoplasma ohiense (nom. inval.)]